MDHRSSVSATPLITPLQQMAALAKETHDAFLGAGFDRKTATDLTVGLLKRG
ncbi:hypothetical protein SEA_OTTAWA_83 [Arthrobacter phage Ottawa]|nr:hypothetical protein SEA_KHARCHO_83 [Arthrobacter phage Kharcho]WIC89315.1 hypothetical protein SEA_OTTAWA_83 [Arthrobacter phage Ottawa]